MKIIFDLRSVGLGNNGGSLTLINSGNTLVDMGHEVFFIDSGGIQNTWIPLKAKHLIIKNNSQIPSADFIIATGYKSVFNTISAPKSCGIKCHWIRGWETWQYNEKTIIKNILKVPTIKLVNGICLQKKLKSFNTESYLIRPGYDFDKIYPLNLENSKKCINIGGLNNQGKHINNKRTGWIFETTLILKEKYGNKIKLWMFGTDNLPSNTVVDKFIRNPSTEEKNKIYNNIDIWLSPAMLEGLHMPPAEAMITKCPVVGTNAPMSGTKDYLIDNETGIVTENDFYSFVNGVEKLCLNNKLRKKLGENARNKILEIGDRRKNMQKLIDLFLTLGK